MDATFAIHGVGLRLKSNNPAFISFAQNYFKGFEHSDSTDTIIDITIQWKPGFSLAWNPTSTGFSHHIGSNVTIDPVTGSCAIHDKEWHIIIHKKEGSLIRAELSFKRNLLRHTANTLFTRGNLASRYYRAALRILAQQLIFIELEKKGINPYSAAAVAIDNKAYIFAGLPGSGKSTISHFLRQQFDAEILTENFVLTDGTYLYPFPEGNTVEHIGSIVIKEIYSISHGSTFSVIPINSETMLHDLAIINAITAELPEHSLISASTLTTPPAPKKAISWNSITFYRLCTDAKLIEAKAYFTEHFSL